MRAIFIQVSSYRIFLHKLIKIFELAFHASSRIRRFSSFHIYRFYSLLLLAFHFYRFLRASFRFYVPFDSSSLIKNTTNTHMSHGP